MVSADWFDRVGIALDIMAGILLAPEILSEDRLQRVEDAMELKISTLTPGSRHEALWTVIRPSVSGFTTIAIVSFVLHCVMSLLFFLVAVETAKHWSIALMIALVVVLLGGYALGIVIAGLGSSLYSIDDSYESDSNSIRVMISAMIVYVGLVISLAPDLLTEIPYHLVRISSSMMLRVLRGDGRLRTTVVYLGILAFIVGNMLQFLATWTE